MTLVSPTAAQNSTLALAEGGCGQSGRCRKPRTLQYNAASLPIGQRRVEGPQERHDRPLRNKLRTDPPSVRTLLGRAGTPEARLTIIAIVALALIGALIWYMG